MSNEKQNPDDKKPDDKDKFYLAWARFNSETGKFEFVDESGNVQINPDEIVIDDDNKLVSRYTKGTFSDDEPIEFTGQVINNDKPNSDDEDIVFFSFGDFWEITLGSKELTLEEIENLRSILPAPKLVGIPCFICKELFTEDDSAILDGEHWVHEHCFKVKQN